MTTSNTSIDEINSRRNVIDDLLLQNDKEKNIQVRYENDTLWMTQKAMAELFDTGIDNINPAIPAAPVKVTYFIK